MLTNSLFFIVKTFLQKEQYKINTNELKLQLLSHPSYPSLHAITGVLHHFGIDNLALSVPKNTETLRQLPTFFIAHIQEDNTGMFVVVTKKNDQLELLFEDKTKKIYQQQDFLTIWNGIVLGLERETSSPHKGNKVKNNFLLLLWGIMTITTCSLFYYFQIPMIEFSYFVLAILGFVCSILIVQQDLGLSSVVIHKFCNISSTSSCQTVFNSKGAKLFGWLKLSDMGLVYFGGLTLAVLFAFSTQKSMPYEWAILSVLSLPVVIYALYYQWQVIKKWCPLCLVLSSILILQVVTVSSLDVSLFTTKLSNLLLLISSFILTAISWFSLKPIIKRYQLLQDMKVKHYKFKRNFTLFNSIFQQSPSINNHLNLTEEVVFGAKNAPLQLMVITNPMCFYCKEAHHVVENILKKHPNDTRLVIRFSVNVKQTESLSYQIVTRILQLYHQDKTMAKQALQDIYSQDIQAQKWLDKWQSKHTTSYHHVLNQAKEWCLEEDIHFTPALFVNGRLFPKFYEQSDLMYFVEELIEQQQTEHDLLAVI